MSFFGRRFMLPGSFMVLLPCPLMSERHVHCPVRYFLAKNPVHYIFMSSLCQGNYVLLFVMPVAIPRFFVSYPS